MNRDSDAIESLLSWLLQVSDPDPETTLSSGRSAESGHSPSAAGDEHPLSESWDSLEAEDLSEDLRSNWGQAELASLGEARSFTLGEISAVQDHVYALLKRRLKAEIEHRPPLFPWETEICDYPVERSDWSERSSVPASPWMAQLQNFRWPITLPEPVLTTLLERCQATVQAGLKPGIKLVQAVEALFPDQTEVLNHLAGMVLVSAPRSGSLSALADSPASERLPSNYDTATTAQQMVLSLLAARDILDSLTLTVSPQHPQLQREWQTEAGPIRLAIALLPGTPTQVQIEGWLPRAGHLHIAGEQVSTVAERSDEGQLSLMLSEPALNQPYALNVTFSELEQSPLRFVMNVTDE